VLREHGATVVEIDPADFNHGRTRNLAGAHARGDVFVFVNKASLPASREWLAPLIAPLVSDPRVAGVTSRVAPHPDADLLVRRDVLRSPSGSSEGFVREVQDIAGFRALPEPERRLLVNFHTVSCGVRPSALRAHPFRDMATIGEDMAWAQDVLEAGWKIVHEPASVVLHSHAYGPLEILQLNVDDGIANHAIVGRTMDESEVVPLIQALVRDDWRYLREDCALGGRDLERWRLTAAIRRTAQVVGHWIGVNHDEGGRELAWRLSRIEATRAGATGA
jgi:rhamnosyltransferase